MTSAIETLDDFLGALHDMTAKVTLMRKEVLLADQTRAELASLNAEKARVQDQVHEVRNQLQILLAPPPSVRKGVANG